MESLGSTILAIGVQGAVGMYRANRSIYMSSNYWKVQKIRQNLLKLKKKKIILEMNMEANCPNHSSHQVNLRGI